MIYLRKTILLSAIFLSLLALYFLIPTSKEESRKEQESMTDETRAVFISYIELKKYFYGKDKDVIQNTIDDMIENIDEYGLNTILLQVRSFSDAIYPSDIFPSSTMIVENVGDPLPLDILEYFIQ